MKTSSCVPVVLPGPNHAHAGFLEDLVATLTGAPRARPAVRARRTLVFALPEVRWAAVSTVLFLAGIAAQFTGGPTWLWWMLYLACYVTGGWEPALAGLQA